MSKFDGFEEDGAMDFSDAEWIVGQLWVWLVEGDDARTTQGRKIKAKNGLSDALINQVYACDDAVRVILTGQVARMIYNGFYERIRVDGEADDGMLLLASYGENMALEKDLLPPPMLEPYKAALKQIAAIREKEPPADMTSAQVLASARKFIENVKNGFDRWFPAEAFTETHDIVWDHTDPAVVARADRLFREAFQQAAAQFEEKIDQLRNDYSSRELVGALLHVLTPPEKNPARGTGGGGLKGPKPR